MASLIQQATGDVTAAGTNQSYTITLGSTPTNGNTLIACLLANNSSSITVSSVSSTGATWTRLVQRTTQAGDSNEAEIWGAFGVSGAGTVITVTMSGTNTGRCSGNVQEWSGPLTSGQPDTTGTDFNTSSTTPDSGNLVTGNANDVLIACCQDFSLTAKSLTSSGWTTLTSIDAIGVAYQIVAATGTYQATWSMGTAHSWSGCGVALKAPAGVSGPAPLAYQNRGKR